MKKASFSIIVIALTMFLGYGLSIAGSQTYYVTQSGRGSQNGFNFANSWSWSDFLSSGNWSTNESTNKIDPGDTVYLSGTFNVGNSTNNIPGGGSGGNYIIIDGDDGINPPANINPTRNGANNCIFVNSKKYLEFRDLTFGGSANSVFKFVSSAHIKVHDNTLDGNYHRGIWFRRSSYIDIYDNSLITSENSEGGDGIKIFASHHANVYRNIVSDWGHTAIQALNDSGDLVNGDTYEIYIYENYMNLPNRGWGRGFAASSWKTAGHTYNIYIHHNYIANMRSVNHVLSAHYVYIHNNIFYNQRNCCESANNEGCVEPSGDPKCLSNTYWKAGMHLDLNTNYGGVSHVYIYNNTFYKSAESALRISNALGDIDNINITNNIFYGGAIAASHLSDNPPGSKNSTFDKSIGAYISDKYNLTQISLTDNIIFTPGRVSDIHWGDRSYTVAEFNDAFAWANGNIDLDPLFVDPTNKNFTLQSTSPAIDAGSSLGSNYSLGWNPDSLLPSSPISPASITMMSQDDNGSAWDIGAYVYDSDGAQRLKPPTNMVILGSSPN